MKTAKLIPMMIVLIWVVAFIGCAPAKQASDQPEAIAGLGLTEQEVVDSYIYILGRYLVIRQEHIDMAEEGVDYNGIKFNELGKAEFVNPNLDVAYLEAWFAVDESTPVILEIPKIEGRYYTAQIVDEWAEIITNINQRNYPDHPYGRYALCLQGSNPEIPEDALRIDLPSKRPRCSPGLRDRVTMPAPSNCRNRFASSRAESLRLKLRSKSRCSPMTRC